jgi:hypothetical protein
MTGAAERFPDKPESGTLTGSLTGDISEREHHSRVFPSTSRRVVSVLNASLDHLSLVFSKNDKLPCHKPSGSSAEVDLLGYAN